MSAKKPLALIILDGWGIEKETRGNAIAKANKPYYDSLLGEYPSNTLKASGEAVGLPEGQMGNSEVGHLNIGAGRVVYQELTRITKAISEGDFVTNEVLVEAVTYAKKNKSALHLMGLLSDGGVHSHITHLYALLELAKKHGLDKVFVHCFLDGRDVPPQNAKEYIQALENKMQELGVGRIATVMGRYYAMDRDQRWERVEKAYDAITLGAGHQSTLAIGAVEAAYSREETDEFVEPTVIKDAGGNPISAVHDKDAVIFFNFRPDRARELTRAFVDNEFVGFKRRFKAENLFYVCMTQYDKTINAPVAFKPQVLVNTLGEVLSKKGLTQLRIAETEKYAHVTFFFNGGVEAPNVGEDRKLIPSPKVATYDLKPEMSAHEVTEGLLKELKADKYDVVVLNYANPDMVGHTGVEEAAIKAIETVDQCLAKVIPAVLAKGGTAIVTADHGNAEQMRDLATNQPQTAHSTNEVPVILVGEAFKGKQLEHGSLRDIAPTMLYILGLEKPTEMTGNCLIKN